MGIAVYSRKKQNEGLLDCGIWRELLLPGNVNLKSYLCHQSSDDGFSTPQPLS